MRQSNQKSRSRGRGRKQQNPMSKNFESNGPDVKIRGNASHIAEKYSSLARDAQSNGDTVMAENYYQHAEHYNRIVAAAQLQNQQRAEEAAALAHEKSQQAGADGESANPDESASENTQKDVSASQEDATSDEATNGANGEQKSKKNGRGRRKPKADVEAADQDQGEPSESNEGDAIPVEVISDDASKLPGSIIGEVAAEEA